MKEKSFTFEVDSQSDLPLWVQLRQRLLSLISTGYYQAGDKLPTVRGLASYLSINYNTVNKAYLSLVSDGYLESTRGRGVFVRDLDAEMEQEYSKEVDRIMGDCVAACRDLGLTLDDTQRCMEWKIKQLKQSEGMDVLRKTAGKAGRIVSLSDAEGADVANVHGA